MLTRRLLLASTALLALLATEAAALPVILGGAGSSGGSSGNIATVTINNFGASAAPADTPIRFPHPFDDSILPNGNTITVTDGGGNTLPVTFARRSRGLNGQLIVCDLLCKTMRSIAAGGSDILTLKSIPGSFSDGLPNGKTIAQIVTDITTNKSNPKVKLSGLNFQGTLEGSGNWQCDASAGFAAGTTVSSTGYYRCVATGPAAADFIVYQPFKDLVGGAAHASLWAKFYITAFLNTSTGAVQSLCGRIRTCQGKDNVSSKGYRAQISVLLNNTVVRGWGGNVGDGRTANFASTDVGSSVANAITLTGNKFVPGQLVQFTTTNTLPTGLSLNTDYIACPTTTSGASSVYFYTTSVWAGSTNGRGAGTYSPPAGFIALTNSGSGTHTVQGYTNFGYYSTDWLADTDGNWDWWQDNTGAFGGKPTLWPVQDKNYYRKTKKTVPIDLSQNLAITSDPTPSQWSPQCLGGISNAPNGTGAHQEYGAPWNEFACRRFNYPGDRAGYVQTHRVCTLAHGAWSVHLFDHSTFRIFACNNTPQHGPYTGINQLPSVDLLNIGGSPPAPSGSIGAIPTNDTSHWWTFSYAQYLFEGGQDILDLIFEQVNACAMQSGVNAGFASGTRNPATSAGTYWTLLQHAGGNPRSAAWSFNQLVDGWVVAPSEGPEASYPEKQYFSDMIADATAYVAFCRSASGFGANFAALGGWNTESTARGPQNVSNVPSAGVAYSGDTVTNTAFMQFYIATSWIYSYMRCPTSGMLTIAQHMGNYVANWWAGNCPHYSNAYNHKVKDAPGWAAGASSNANFSTIANLGLQPQGIDGVLFSEDGHTCYMLNNASSALAQIPPQNGDRIWFWDGYDVTQGSGSWDAPPTGVTTNNWYFMHNVGTMSGLQSIVTFTLSTTDPTDTQVTWTPSNAVSQATLNGSITSGSTSIPLNSAVTTSKEMPSALAVVKIDSEYLSVIQGTNITTLTTQATTGFPDGVSIPGRGAYGSTAAAHNSGATATCYKCNSNFMVDVQNRASGCPATSSQFGNGGGVPFGYLTGWRQSCGFAAMAGILSATAFNNADALFQAYNDAQDGPGAWAIQSSLMLSVAPGLTF